MPAVTVNSVKYTVAGSVRNNFYNVTGNSGDTLVSGLTTIKQIICDSGITATSTPAANGMTTITFGGVAPTNANIQVIGY